jgi:hypothetical protein
MVALLIAGMVIGAGLFIGCLVGLIKILSD